MRAFLFVLCFTASGCVIHQSYPDHWAPLIYDSNKCPDLTGAYENRGWNVGTKPDEEMEDRPLLSTYLAVDCDDASEITVDHAMTGRLSASCEREDGKTVTRVFRFETPEDECDKGIIWQESEFDSMESAMTGSVVPVAFSFKSYTMWKAVESIEPL